jgi:hypothetical protein
MRSVAMSITLLRDQVVDVRRRLKYSLYALVIGLVVTYVVLRLLGVEITSDPIE